MDYKLSYHVDESTLLVSSETRQRVRDILVEAVGQTVESIVGTFSNALPPQSDLTEASLLNTMRLINESWQHAPPTPPWIRLQVSAYAGTRVPRVAHARGRKPSYHARIQKKWNKRFGFTFIPGAFVLGPLPSMGNETVLIVHPTLERAYRAALAAGDAPWN